MKRCIGALVCILAFVFVGSAGASAKVQSLHVVNDSSMSQAQLAQIEQAIAWQVNTQISPVWHTPHIVFGSTGWIVKLVNTMPDYYSGDDGVHFVKHHHPFALCMADSVTISHEIDEMMVDPSGLRVWHGWAVEIDDPVAVLSYTHQGVDLSDFVTPNWFVRGSHGPFDFLHKVKRPLGLMHGYGTMVFSNGFEIQTGNV